MPALHQVPFIGLDLLQLEMIGLCKVFGQLFAICELRVRWTHVKDGQTVTWAGKLLWQCAEALYDVR